MPTTEKESVGEAGRWCLELKAKPHVDLGPTIDRETQKEFLLIYAIAL